MLVKKTLIQVRRYPKISTYGTSSILPKPYRQHSGSGEPHLSTTLIVTAIVCLAIGGAAGVALARLSHPRLKQRRELESKLQRAQDELKAYQQEVTEHFIKTSGLVNNLTHSYRAVHEHLAASALHLANPDISRQLLNAGAGNRGGGGDHPTSNALPEHMPEPPKDYAPKAPEGVLSESYGLKDDYGIEARPDNTVANDLEDDDDQDRPPLKAV